MSHRRRQIRHLMATLVLAASYGLLPPGAAHGQTDRPAADAQAQPAGPGASRAAAEDIYTVRDVEVDVTAANSAAARDEAIVEAQREAFATLAQRLAAPGEPVPQVGDAELSRAVQGFEVQRERSSGVRYVATLTVSFRPNAVRDLLRDNAVSFTEMRSKPVLMLPVFRPADGDAVLWEDRTPWREAWENAPLGAGLVPIAMPYGELADVADVSAGEALAGDRTGFDAIASRYGAGDVAVAVLDVPAGGIDPAQPARVTVTRYTEAGAEPARTLTIPAAPGSPVEDYLAAGVAAVDSMLEEEWKLATSSASREERSLRVSVPIARLDDWVRTRRQLSQVPAVVRAELRALSRDEADVDLVYMGDPERLRTVLAQYDLLLDRAPPDPMTVPGVSGGLPGLPGMPPAALPDGSPDGLWTGMPGQAGPGAIPVRPEDERWQLRPAGSAP